MAKIKAEELIELLKKDKKITLISGNSNSESTTYYCAGIDHCINVITALVNDKQSKKAKKANKPHKITETCTFCENEVTLYWDTKHDGYNIYCPCCGKEMELSDAYYREVTAKEQELK